MNEQPLPAGHPDAVPLSFKEIDEQCANMLAQLDNAIRMGMPKPLQLDAMETIILGTLKEMLKTLQALHPEVPRIALPLGRN